MTLAHEPEPIKLIVGVLFRQQETLTQAMTELAAQAGPYETMGPAEPFAWSPYYNEEMGGPPLRQFFAFLLLHPQGELVRWKLCTGAIEDRYRNAQGQRTINLDPGYLSLGNLVLATTKEATHRIYLGQGIWADLTLTYRKGEYQTFPWTYPDYASAPVRAWLHQLREQLRCQRKTLSSKA